MVRASPFPVPPVKFTMARMPLRSMTARASFGVVLKVTSSPVETPFAARVVQVRWEWTSITG